MQDESKTKTIVDFLAMLRKNKFQRIAIPIDVQGGRPLIITVSKIQLMREIKSWYRDARQEYVVSYTIFEYGGTSDLLIHWFVPDDRVQDEPPFVPDPQDVGIPGADLEPHDELKDQIEEEYF